MALWLALTASGAASLAAWLAILVSPARPWDLRPIAEDEPERPAPHSWPRILALVPARNEAEYLPRTLPALLAQEYCGELRVVVVDDRSTDATAEAARALDHSRLAVLEGAPLPEGWAGKVWALEQGRRSAGPSDYLLLSDADIRHSERSLRRLVAESEAAGLALNSRMARLRAASVSERLLIPPFLFFFNLLYPMRRVNDPADRLAAAAGGCVLVRRDALEQAGGFEAVRGEIIDDVNLARRVQRSGGRVRLSVSRSDVVSLREYGSIQAVWRMVRRTAFDELRYSWLLLTATAAGLLLLFACPPGLVALAAAGLPPGSWRLAIVLLGASAWGVMAYVYSRTLRYFELGAPWALTLPLGGLLYGCMTVDSALRHATGRGQRW